jgi:hypothetical protein
MRVLRACWRLLDDWRWDPAGAPPRRPSLRRARPGDCYLVRQLRDAYGYHVLRLDDVYVDFVLSRYPSFHFPGLRQVVAPHYQIIMRHLAGSGTSSLECFFEDWGDYVAGVVAQATSCERRVVVEGWVLLPAPGAIRARLAEMASVTVVEACNDRRCDAGTVTHIHHDVETPFRHPHDSRP